MATSRSNSTARTARADGDHRPEERVVCHADQHLDAASHHLLDEEAIQCQQPAAPNALRDLPPCLHRLRQARRAPSATAPTSVLCTMPGPNALIATGWPILAAASAASSGVLAPIQARGLQSVAAEEAFHLFCP